MTPYYSLEHGGMLEYALRVNETQARGNLGICAQYSLNVETYLAHEAQASESELMF